MIALRELSELEQTIIDLVVELLLLDKESRYPDLILGNNADDPTAVRLTMCYMMALLSYGFAPDEQEIVRAGDWFDKVFPKQRYDEITAVEMNRLIVMLHLNPHSPHVQTRLTQLASQKSGAYFDVQPGHETFDTLWALEAFSLAARAGVLDEKLMPLEEIRERLDYLFTQRDLRTDKHTALALRLQYETFGTLEKHHESALDELIRNGLENQGLWEMREIGWKKTRMPWYEEYLAGKPLTIESVKAFAVEFRKTILSTCMVIENLMPLLDDYPQLQEPLEQAMRLWWTQFEWPNVANKLRGLFPEPVDYLRVLTGTLRAVRAYVQKPLVTLSTLHMLRELADMKTNLDEPPEVRNIKNALREWLQIDLTGGLERLRLGFSEADVVRVQPRIWSPLSRSADEPGSMIRQSVVVKYGPFDMIQNERLNYGNLPGSSREFFVKIPESSYIDTETGQAFVIMQDLGDYKTLYEVRDAVSQHADFMAELLARYLQGMHDSVSLEPVRAQESLLRDIYLNRMFEYIDRIFNFVQEFQIGQDDTTFPDIRYQLFDRIGDIIRLQRPLEAFPAACMHGDLHMRNIMIRGLDGSGQMNRDDITFKLIDLEFLKRYGDAAFDAGELLVDITLIATEDFQPHRRDNLLKLRDKMDAAYKSFSQRRHDDTFGVRMELAKARALLRIAKGKTKRGTQAIHNNLAGQAGQIGQEVMSHAQEALHHLENVVNALS